MQRAKRTAKVLGWITALVLVAPLPFVFVDSPTAGYAGLAVLGASWFFLLPILLLGLFICAVVVAVKTANDPMKSAQGRTIRAAIWGFGSVAVLAGAVALGGATLPVLVFLGAASILMQIAFWATFAGAKHRARGPKIGLVITVALTVLLLAQSMVAQQYVIIARDLSSIERMTERDLRNTEARTAAICLSVPGHEAAIADAEALISRIAPPVLPEATLDEVRRQLASGRTALAAFDGSGCEAQSEEMSERITAQTGQEPSFGTNDVSLGSKAFVENLLESAGLESLSRPSAEPVSFWVAPWSLSEIAHEKDLAVDRLEEARVKANDSEKRLNQLWDGVQVDTSVMADVAPTAAEQVIAAAPAVSDTEAGNLRALAQTAKRSGVAGLVAYVDAANEMLGR